MIFDDTGDQEGMLSRSRVEEADKTEIVLLSPQPTRRRAWLLPCLKIKNAMASISGSGTLTALSLRASFLGILLDVEEGEAMTQLPRLGMNRPGV